MKSLIKAPFYSSISLKDKFTKWKLSTQLLSLQMFIQQNSVGAI